MISRLFAFMGGGAAISAATVFLLTAVPEYREFLYVRDAEGLMMLSVGAWILLLLPLMMFLSVPKELKALSFAAVLLIFGLFCSLVGAALSGVAVVYIKADMACALGVARRYVCHYGRHRSRLPQRHDFVVLYCRDRLVGTVAERHGLRSVRLVAYRFGGLCGDGGYFLRHPCLFGQ